MISSTIQVGCGTNPESSARAGASPVVVRTATASMTLAVGEVVGGLPLVLLLPAGLVGFSVALADMSWVWFERGHGDT